MLWFRCHVGHCGDRQYLTLNLLILCAAVCRIGEAECIHLSDILISAGLVEVEVWNCPLKRFLYWICLPSVSFYSLSLCLSSRFFFSAHCVIRFQNLAQYLDSKGNFGNAAYTLVEKPCFFCRCMLCNCTCSKNTKPNSLCNARYHHSICDDNDSPLFSTWCSGMIWACCRPFYCHLAKL